MFEDTGPDAEIGPTFGALTVVIEVVSTVDDTGITLVITEVVVTTLGVVSTEVVPEAVTVSPIVFVVTKVEVEKTVLKMVTVCGPEAEIGPMVGEMGLAVAVEVTVSVDVTGITLVMIEVVVTTVGALNTVVVPELVTVWPDV